MLWAFNPADLTQEYYDSQQNPKRDMVHGGATRISVTVANGRVYVPSRTEIDVYGLLQ